MISNSSVVMLNAWQIVVVSLAMVLSLPTLK
jgi:hypothetical protein